MTAALTQIYADFIAGCRHAVVPEPVLEVARLGFTDGVGVMLAGRDEEAVQRIGAYVAARGERPLARAVTGGRGSMVSAALVNATAAHALDYDDFAFSNHPSAVLVPTILAAADASGADGSNGVNGACMAAAYAAGYEVWADLMVREPDLYYDRGWHPTAVLGPVGAAAAASVVMGLDATRTRHALALAASSSGGVFENFGTMAKPWHGGHAAAAGIEAAALAAAGLEASATALEGERGMMRALSPHGRVDLRTAPELGRTWRSATMRLNVKKYPVVGAAQRGIDAVLAVRRGDASIDPHAVRRIVARISERHAAVMPYHLPQDALQAKFSLEFALASALVHGTVGFAQLTDAVVRSPLVQQLMACVEIETTADFEPEWRDAAPFDQVTFTLADDRVVQAPPVRRATGHADTPLSRDELRSKFMGCMQHARIDEPLADALFESLQSVDRLQSAAGIRWA